MKHWFVLYKIFNLVNDNIYIGIHKTSNILDNYMGSGKILKFAIKKYGRCNFIKSILNVYDNLEDVLTAEQLIVDNDFISRTDTYNIGLGGGFGSELKNGLTFKGHKHSDSAKERISKASYNRNVSYDTRKKLSNNNFSKRETERQKEHAKKAGKLSANIRKKLGNMPLDIRAKISESLKATNSGNIHPNLGKIRTKIVCPFCKKDGAKNTMLRFHFENCKFKNAL